MELEERDFTFLACLVERRTIIIFSIGYNSNFKGGAVNLNTIDFAKDLLYPMLTFSGCLVEQTEGTRPWQE
jgi:hypothetical protein